MRNNKKYWKIFMGKIAFKQFILGSMSHNAKGGIMITKAE